MLTIFTNPRPFQGPFNIIQRNAILSWTRLQPKCEIILFEDEEGTTSKVAKEFGVHYVADVKCNEFGTPLLSDVFEKTKKIAQYEILAQVNTDIILMQDFIEAISQVKELIGEKPFFMTGRRWDLDINEELNFKEADWEQKLRDQIAKEGKLHGLSGMDYWVFPRNFQLNPSPFVVGRPGMDSWLIYQSRNLKIPVIDATETIKIIHQNHNYPRKKKPFFEIEMKRNIKLAGGLANMGSLRDADWLLREGKLVRPGFPRLLFSWLFGFPFWRAMLSLKRRVGLLWKKKLL